MPWDVELEGLAAVDTMLQEVADEYGAMGTHTVKSGVDYAVYVEFGTSAHVIRPNGADVLAFESGGETVFAKEVKHPGTPPNGALRAAAKEAMANLDTIAASASTPEQITERVAEYIARGWRSGVWVDTGKLRASIHVEAV